MWPQCVDNNAGNLFRIRIASLSAVTNERKRLMCRNAASRAIVALALTKLRQKMKSRTQGLNLFTNCD